MRKRLWQIGLWTLAIGLCTTAARAQFAAQWFFQDFTQNNQPVKAVYLTPLWNVSVFNQTNIIASQRSSKQTDSRGSLIVSNMVPGGYRVEFIGPNRTNVFTNCFDSSIPAGSLVNAASNICVGTNMTGSSDYAYTRQQVDAMLAALPVGTNSGNVTGPTDSTIGEIPYFDQITGQHLGRSGILYTTLTASAIKAVADASATAATNSQISVITNHTLLHSNNTAQVRVATNYNLISGSLSNGVLASVFDSTIAGGGNAGEGAGLTGGSNYIASSQATISGGAGNLIGSSSDESTIGGGTGNSITNGPDESLDNTIGGGFNNGISGNQNTISGGSGNKIVRMAGSYIGGGGNNITNSATEVEKVNSAIVGSGNRIEDSDRAFIGGIGNVISNATGAAVIGYAVTNTTPYSVKIGYQDKAVAVLSNGNVSVTGTLTVQPASLNPGAASFALGVTAAGTMTTNSVPGGGSGAGTVTSVGLTVPGEFSVAGSPITGSGTLAVTRTADANFIGFGATNLGFVRIGGSLSADTMTVTNGFTNLSLTASTLIKADANKKTVSIANGVGALTNDASGNFGYAPLLDASALVASQYMATDGNTNPVSTLNGFSWTNLDTHFTNYGTVTNIVLPADGNNWRVLATNGPHLFLNFGGNNSGALSIWITTNGDVKYPPSVSVLGYSNTLVTNCIIDFQPWGGTNRVLGAQSEL